MNILEHPALQEKQVSVLKNLLHHCWSQGIRYQITGGLAGNIYGSLWKLHDIDLEMSLRDVYAIEKDYRDYVRVPTTRYVDEEFDMWLLQLEIDGVSIDINAIEDCFILVPPDRQPYHIETSLNKALTYHIHDLPIVVQPLSALIHYKILLQRHDDVRDLLSCVTTIIPTEQDTVQQ